LGPPLARSADARSTRALATHRPPSATSLPAALRRQSPLECLRSASSTNAAPTTPRARRRALRARSARAAHAREPSPALAWPSQELLLPSSRAQRPSQPIGDAGTLPFEGAERGNRADAAHGIRQEYLLGRFHIRWPQRLFARRDAELARRAQHLLAHDATHTTEAQIRRQQNTVSHDEDIARGGAHELAFRVEHQAFGGRSIVPFRLSEHLLEPIEMLDARQARVAPQSRPTPAQPQSARRVVLGRRIQGDDSRRDTGT